jgi:hypothetical protein
MLSQDPDTRPEELRGYTQLQRWINYAGLLLFVAFFVLMVGYLWDIHAAQPVQGVGWYVALGLLMSLPVADFITGLVHWAADNWGSEDWPIIGGFVRPFRNHHVDPEEMTTHGFIEAHGDHAVVCIFGLWFGTMADGGGAWRIFWGTMWLGIVFLVLATADIHAWAHTPEPPRVVRWLQRTGVILGPEHHAVHHQEPYADNYCITTGWMNAPLRWLGFFRALERLMTVVTGQIPRHRQAKS